jgi:hypothetical protein
VWKRLIAKESVMLSSECLRELRTAWLPNITDAGLARVIDLLEKGSPLLVHGCFTRVVPMGCLASHIAWNHPETAHHTVDAGIAWLHGVAGLNPATSQVLAAWDRQGTRDLDLCADLLALFRREAEARTTRKAEAKPRSQPVPV